MALAGSSLLFAGSLRANTEIDVAPETTTGGVDLSLPATYTGGVSPGTTNDLTFNATNNYSAAAAAGNSPAVGLFIDGKALPIGTFNDLSTSQALTITNGNVSTQSPITLNGGTNSVASANGGSAADLLFVSAGANLTFSNIKPSGAVGNTVSIVLGAANGNFDIIGTAAISAPITGGNGFTKTGAGTLTLSGTNTFTGGTTINAGTLQIGSGTVAGALATAGGIVVNNNGTTTTGALVFSSTAAQTYAGVISGTGGLTKMNTGTTVLSGANTYTGVTAINGGTLQIGNGGTAGSLASANIVVNNNGTTTTGALSFSSTAAQNYAGVISGTGGVTNANTGTTTLSGANTYTGVTAANAGVLQLTGSLSSSSALSLGGGTFAYAPTAAGSTQTLTGTTINPGNSAITVTAGNTLALGTITRNGNTVLSFGTTGGTITASNAGVNGILGPYAFTNAGTSLSYVTAGTIAAYTTGTAAPDATGVTNTTGTVNYNVAAGGMTGTGASANTLRYTGAADTITGPLTLNGLMNAGTGALAVNGAVTIGATRELVVLSNGQSITLGGPVGNNGANASALTYGGPTAGTLMLNGASTYTGATTVNAGTVTVGVASVAGVSGALGNNSAVTLANVTGVGLNLNSFNTQIGSLTGGGTIGGNVTLGTATLTVGGDNTSPAAYAGVISGTGGLTKIGTGTQTLSANSNYTGATVINGGTLTLTGGNNGAGTLSGTPTITVNNGGTLVLTNGDTIGYTAGKEALVINSGGQVLNNGVGVRDTLQNTVTMTGGILGGTSAGDANGTYSFDVTTVGTNTVLATSDANGTPARINATSAQLQTANQIFNVTRGTATPAADMVINASLIGGNGFTKTGNGILMLTAANTYTGATTVNAGSLFLSSTSNILNAAGTGAGAVSVTGTGTTLGGAGTIGGNITVGAGAILTAGNLALATPAVGTLTTGPLTLQTGSIFNALLASNTSFSTLSATGTTDLSNAAFSISLKPGATFTNGQVLELITSSVANAFTNTTYTAGGYTFTADYSLGDFAVDVAPAAVPEPSTWAGLVAMAGLAGCVYRRRLHARLG